MNFRNFKNSEVLLELRGISVHYGGVKALNNISLEVNAGEIVALMGPNGAGKSTILKTIFGLTSIDRGEIFWHGQKITPIPYEMASLGMSFVPQGRRVFKHLTVEENLEIGGYCLKNQQELHIRKQEVLNTFPVLKYKLKMKSRTLSGGQQQMLAIARGLMTNPKLLLLDEPSLGLAPRIVKEVFAKIAEINRLQKTTIVIVEHNLKTLLEIVNRAYVLDKGQIVTEDSGQKIIHSDVLEKVFLGKI